MFFAPCERMTQLVFPTIGFVMAWSFVSLAACTADPGTGSAKRTADEEYLPPAILFDMRSDDFVSCEPEPCPDSLAPDPIVVAVPMGDDDAGSPGSGEPTGVELEDTRRGYFLNIDETTVFISSEEANPNNQEVFVDPVVITAMRIGDSLEEWENLKRWEELAEEQEDLDQSVHNIGFGASTPSSRQNQQGEDFSRDVMEGFGGSQKFFEKLQTAGKYTIGHMIGEVLRGLTPAGVAADADEVRYSIAQGNAVNTVLAGLGLIFPGEEVVAGFRRFWRARKARNVFDPLQTLGRQAGKWVSICDKCPKIMLGRRISKTSLMLPVMGKQSFPMAFRTFQSLFNHPDLGFHAVGWSVWRPMRVLTDGPITKSTVASSLSDAIKKKMGQLVSDTKHTWVNNSRFPQGKWSRHLTGMIKSEGFKKVYLEYLTQKGLAEQRSEEAYEAVRRHFSSESPGVVYEQDAFDLARPPKERAFNVSGPRIGEFAELVDNGEIHAFWDIIQGQMLRFMEELPDLNVRFHEISDVVAKQTIPGEGYGHVAQFLRRLKESEPSASVTYARIHRGGGIGGNMLPELQEETDMFRYLHVLSSDRRLLNTVVVDSTEEYFTVAMFNDGLIDNFLRWCRDEFA